MTTMNETNGGPGAIVPIAAVAGAAVGFALVWFGLPLLGAIEHGVGIRAAMALLAAAAFGVGAAIVARGRAVAASMESEMLADAPPALQAHRSKRVRARLTALASGAVGAGLGYLGFVWGYAHLDVERDAWREPLEVGTLELGVALGFGLAVGFTLYVLTRPGAYVEDEALPDDLPTGDGSVSDAELDATAARVRSVRRRTSLAKFVSTFGALGTLAGLTGFALPALSEALDTDTPGSFYWMSFALSIAVGVGLHRLLRPPVDVHQLFDEPLDEEARASLDAAITPSTATLAETVGDAGRLSASRSASALSWLGFDLGRRYAIDADHVALASAAETLPLWMRVLPAYLLPYAITIEDEQEGPLCVRGGPLATTFAVTAGDAPLGRLVKTPFLRRLRIAPAGGGGALEIRGSLFFRREHHILRDGARVGYVQVSRSQGALSSLLSGREVSLELELPSEASAQERRLLLAALPLLDRLYY